MGTTDELAITDPDVDAAARRLQAARDSGDMRQIAGATLNENLAILSKLRAMRAELEARGTTDTEVTLADLEGRIADFERKAVGPNVTLSSETRGDIVCKDPTVIEAGLLYAQAAHEGGEEIIATRSYELHEAIATWLSSRKRALENGEAIEVDANLGDVNELLAHYEQKAAELATPSPKAAPEPVVAKGLTRLALHVRVAMKDWAAHT